MGVPSNEPAAQAVDPAVARSMAKTQKPPLHGRKRLVTGNNDPPACRALPGWADVQPYIEVEADGTALVLCHYAFRTWRGMGRGAINLHGHSHGRLRPMPRQFDVGVDVHDFRPVRLTALLEKRR